MHNYTLAHLTDAALLHDLAALVARDRITTATLLAHIAEVDARKLYVPAGYPSMFEYCVDELRLSEDAAYRRIRAARAARQFPVLFTELTEGRLHLAAICLLAPHLTLENADDLIAAARRRKKSEIEIWLAGRFPAPEARALVRALSEPVPTRSKGSQLVPGRVGSGPYEIELVPGRVGIADVSERQLVPGRVEAPMAPSPRFLVQVTIGESTHDKLKYVQNLLGHSVPAGDVAQVLDRALDALIAQLERHKLGAARRPGRPETNVAPRRSLAGARYVPASVRRAVWERDAGRCTFVGPNGKRCPARRLLEFDHVEPVARGGTAEAEGMRLRCRAHNQFEAEQCFGKGFMRQKREEAAKRQQARLVAARARANAAREQSLDVIAGLRSLGCRADEARRAAELTETLQGATLEERMRAALEFLGSRSKRGHMVPAATG